MSLAATRLVMVNPLRNNCMSRACIRSFAQKVDDSNPTTSEPQDLHKLKKELNELPEKSLYWEYGQKEFGHVYDKKPVKVRCVEGKIYMWCNCGRSNSQPFCDGTHRQKHYEITLQPIPFKCKETKDYWFCNCKQTKMKPFCDGTHKEDKVKNAKSTIRY